MYSRTAICCLVFLIMPLFSHGQMSHKAIPRVSFDFMDADIRNVLRVLTDISGRNIVMGEDVKGKLTMKLENIPWDEALEVVVKNNDLARIDDGNIIRVVSSKRHFDEREKERKDRLEFLKEKEAKQKTEEDFATETVFLNYVDATEVERMVRGISSSAPGSSMAPGASSPGTPAAGVRSLLTPNGTISLVRWNNAVIIRDTRENTEALRRTIKEHDIRPAQVQIEARIVQASSTFVRDLGVQWGARYAGRIRGEDVEGTGGRTSSLPGSNSTFYNATTENMGMRGNTPVFPYNVNLPAAVQKGAGGVLGIFVGSVTDSFQLDVQLSALENEGKVKIISHPKVIASDNKAAKVNQGKVIPYQTTSLQGTQTQFADAFLGLEVTPQVTKDGYIRLKIRANKDAADFTQSTVAGPTIDKKETVTEVIVKDGETAVIGGIYETTEALTNSSVPFLSKIPVLGWLFNREQKERGKTELLIFITPIVLKNLYAEGGR
jgi:type IV pilus assembly protein PilQ